MSLEDPFFVVKDEVQKAVQSAKSLFQRWTELSADPADYSKEEKEWTTNELKNSLRSIEWDLEDLEETISIVEKNPKKFKIDDGELRDRKGFIERTKQLVQEMKEQMSSPKPTSSHNTTKTQPFNGPKRPQDKYQRLENEVERANQKYMDDIEAQQQMMIEGQDDQLDRVGTSVGTLKHMSRQIGSELDEQQLMLDDFATEMENTDGKMDNVMKKIAKVMHMSNDRRQWIAIVVLVVIMIIVIMLFFIL